MEILLFENDYWLWTVFVIIISIALAIDLGLAGKIKNLKKKLQDIEHVQGETLAEKTLPPIKEALIWTIAWIALAGVFAGIVFIGMGYDKLLEYVSGYILEKSLSVDNMFMFLLIFSSLGIPYQYQHRVLSVGIINAIVMRILIILAGISLIETFDWMIYVFAALILFTAIRMLTKKKEKR